MLLAEFPISPFGFEHPKAIVALVLGFVLLVFVVHRYGAPPITRMLEDRARRVADAQAQAARQLTEAQQVHNDYAARIAGIEEEHRSRLAAAVRDAEAARADILADAREAAIALRRRSEQEMDRERTRQRILVRRQIVEFTLDAAENAIRQLHSDGAQRRLIDDFIRKAAGNGSRTVQAVTAGVSPAGAFGQSGDAAGPALDEAPARQEPSQTQSQSQKGA